ncbi:MAG: MBL fold metallo-hydrolase [Spirochaetae bacterium HGW-Spirochaetae-7]|jgi:metallo-beta-lactamase family protein|nr:MAG: MBL fold metallo-hydrolase [Spirochaetae bacterium HGW-Spirochaetae-7]
MAITFHSEGAAREVTGSKHVLEVDGTRYLVDCGAFQGKRDESDRKNRALVRDPESIDSVILTHAHFDHCGLLPLLVKRGFKGNIYSTPATRDLANIIMMDSAHIQARDAEYLGKQAAKRGTPFDWKPMYDEVDAVKATGQFVTVSYDRPIQVGRNLKLKFRDAGHILGSATAHVTATADDGRVVRIGFCGDLGRPDKPIIRDPETMDPVDYIVVESTYGDRRHESTVDAMERLARVVNDTVKRGGKIIIPAFAIERTQELIYYFHMLVDQGRIPKIPIWVDSPMAINATSIFQVHPECFDKETNEAFTSHHANPFGFNELHFSSSVDDSKMLNRLDTPAIIMSADGMCEAGRIQHHLIHNIADDRNTILIVGYMAANTLGRRIRDGQKEVRIHGDLFRVKARIEEIKAFSAHADYVETWDWMSRMDLSSLKTVFLVHGEDEAITTLKKFLEGKGLKDVRIVEYGENYEL